MPLTVHRKCVNPCRTRRTFRVSPGQESRHTVTAFLYTPHFTLAMADKSFKSTCRTFANQPLLASRLGEKPYPATTPLVQSFESGDQTR